MGLTRLKFGPVALTDSVTRVGMPMQESGELTLCVPDDVLTYTVYLKTEVGAVVVSSFVPPGAEEQIDPSTEASLRRNIEQEFSTDWGWVTITPNGFFQPGLTTLRVAAESASVELDVWVRRGAAPSRRVALNFVFGPNAATEAEIDNIEDSVSDLRSKIALFGVELFHVGFGSVDSNSLSPYVSNLENSNAVYHLPVAQLPGRPTLADEALTVYVVDRIVWRGIEVNGLATAVPGFFDEPDMPGVFVSTVNARSFFGLGPIDLNFFNLVVAHECGHWWGLKHTSNAHGDKHDHIRDTPECTPAQDSDGDGYLLSEECADLDGPNIMFWTTSTDPPVITPEQQAWIAANLPDM